MQHHKQCYDATMKDVSAIIAGIIGIGVVYIGWTWFFETKSILDVPAEEFTLREIDVKDVSFDSTSDVVGDTTQVFLDLASSTITQKEVSGKVFQSEWLKWNVDMEIDCP